MKPRPRPAVGGLGGGGGAEDADLIRRCLAGDERAYRELVGRYQRQVYTVLIASYAGPRTRRT